MPVRVFSRRIESKDDMLELEQTIGRQLGCEAHKCAFVRSRDFVKIRLLALYKEPPADTVVVYGEGLKITLTPDRVASVYLLDLCIDPDPALGKRTCPEPEDEDSFDP